MPLAQLMAAFSDYRSRETQLGVSGPSLQMRELPDLSTKAAILEKWVTIKPMLVPIRSVTRATGASTLQSREASEHGIGQLELALNSWFDFCDATVCI